MEKNNTNTVAARPKSKAWLIVLLAALMIAGGLGYYFTQMNKPADDTVENTKTEPDKPKQEPAETKEPDHTLINGYWKSETTEDGRFLEFTIDYPEVTNFNGMKGPVNYDAKLNRYAITLKDETGESVFYIGEFEKNAGKVFYYEEDDGEELFLTLNRDPESVPDNVIDKPAEQKPETGTTNSGNNKPSASTGNAKPSGSDSANNSGNSSNNPKGHYEERQVCVQEAYDEQVLVKKGECTNVLVKEAYDSQEMVYLDGAYYGSDMQEVMVCNQCGEVFWNGGAAEHVANSDTCGSYHNDYLPINDPYWHNVEYKTVHHDAVYETRCEPDEYKTVHHDAVYETQMVWVED